MYETAQKQYLAVIAIHQFISFLASSSELHFTQRYVDGFCLLVATLVGDTPGKI